MTESDYTEMVEALSKITLADGSTANVSLVDSAGQFRDVYDIISDIANVWDKMDANSKSGLAEKLAGTRQQDVFFSLINNFNDTKQAMDDMANSAGNMQEAYDTYLNSTEAHVNSFKAAMTGLGADIFQTDRMNAVVDVGRAIINVIDGIVKAINALGGVKTILISVIAGFALFKSQNVAETVAASLGKLVGILPKIATSFSSMGSAVAGAVPSLMAAKTGTEAFAAILPMLGVGLAGVSLVVGAISLVAEQEAEAMRKATEAARENYEASSNLSSSYETILRYADSGELATSSDNELADAISNVSDALGGKYNSLQDVIAAQDEYIEKVREAAKEESANLARSSSILMGAEETNIRSAFKDINTNTIGYLGQKYDSDAYSIAKNVFDKISGINAQGDNADFKDIISAYYELIDVRNQLADQGIVTGDTVDALSGAISSAKESVESYTNAMYDNLKATHESNNGVVDTISEYNQLKDSIDDYINNNLGGNGSIKEVMLSKLRSEFSGVLDIAAADAVENSGEKTDEAVKGFAKKIRRSLELQSGFDRDDAKSWAKEIINDEELRAAADDYLAILDEFNGRVKDLNLSGVDKNTSVFGNIDLNNRPKIEWTKELVNQYSDVLKNTDWGEDIIKDVEAGFETVSTVLGSSQEFEGIEIAFSPLLNKDGELVPLSDQTVSDYLWEIASSAMRDGKWSEEEVLELDKVGLSIDGQQISGLIAAAGDNAIAVSEVMHYLGTDGALNLAMSDVAKAAEDYEISAGTVIKAFSENTDDPTTVIFKDIKNNSDIAKDEINSVMDAYDQLSDEMKSSVYASSYDEGGTFLGYGNFKKQIEGAQFSYEDLMAEKGKDDAPSFADKVSEYTSQIDKLKSAYDSLKKGELDDSAIRDLEIAFPSLTGKTDSLGDAIMNLAAELTGGMNEFGEFDGIIGEFQDQFGRLSTEEDRTQLQELLNTITELAEGIGSFNFDIDVEQNGFTALMNALKESASITGASENSILALTERFKGLSGMDDELSSLFEKTNLGIRVNQEALTKLENKYEEVTQNNIDSKLAELSDSYVDLSLQINECNNASDLSILNARRDAIAKEIENVSVLGSQYEALSSDYMKWQESLNNAEEGDMYDKFTANLDDVQDRYEAGLIGTDKFRNAVQLMSNKDVTGMSASELAKEYEKKKSITERYFKDTEHGIDNFLTDLNKENSEWVSRANNGAWVLSFDVDNLEEISNAVGISTDAIDIIIKKLHDYGYEVEMASKYTDALSEAQKAADDAIKRQNKRKGAKKKKESRGYDYDLTSTNKLDLDNQISDAIEEYNKAKVALTKAFKDGATSEEIKVKTDEVQDAELVVRALIGQYQSLDEPVIMRVDASQIDNVDISGLISNLQEMYNLCNEREIQIKEGASTEETDQKIQSISKTLLGIPKEVYTNIGLKKDEMSGILNGISGTDISANITFNENIISNLKSQIQSVDDDDIKLVVDTSQASRQVKILSDDINNLPSSKQFTLNTYGLTNLQLMKRIQDQLGGETTLTVKTSYVTSGRPRNTTGLQEYHKGTVGDVLSSFARGTGLKHNAIAGELGEELLVRDGKAYMLGVGSAQFFDYKRGDLIFDAEQTAQLKKTGKITSGQTRAMAYASGTGLPVASAFADKKYGATGPDGNVSNGSYNPTKPAVKNNYDSSSKSKTKTDSGDKTKKKTETALDKFKKWLERFVDWVEVKVARRLESVTKKLKSAERYLDRKNYDSAARSYRSAISGTARQAQLNREAKSTYESSANKVLKKAVADGIISQKSADNIVKKVENGSLRISDYGEKQREVISNYKEWADKAKECSDQVQELHDNIRQYISDLKDLRDAQRDNKIERIDAFGNIGTSGFAPSAGTSSSFANMQLSRENRLLDNRTKAYATAESKNRSDVSKLGKAAIKSLTNDKPKNKKANNKKYKQALKDAESYIKKRKKVPYSICNTIKKYSRVQYEKIYAYNLSLDNAEDARLEYIVESAANTAAKYANNAQKYDNKDNATQNRISLYESKAENSSSYKTKNDYLYRSMRSQDAILENDRAEIREAKSAANKYASRIRNRKKNQKYSYKGVNYSNSSKDDRKKVRDFIKKIRARVKANKPITPTQLDTLARYTSKGLISERFFNYCINYNEALNQQVEAEAEYEIDKQTAKAYKKQAREQMLSNIEERAERKQNKYTKREDRYNTNTNLYEAKADNAKTTKTKNDYINEAVKEQDKVVENDRDQLKEFSSLLSSRSKRIQNTKYKNHGKNYDSAAKKDRSAVDALIKKIKSTVKDGKRISRSDLNDLGKYLDRGLVTNAFYQACLEYNVYYDKKKEAQDKYDIDKETNKAYKEQARAQVAANFQERVEKKQTKFNKRDDESNRKISLYEAKADNAVSVSDKNDYLRQAMSEQDTILKNDKDEIAEFKDLKDKSAKRIKSSTGKNHGSKYKNASEEKKKKVDALIEKIKSTVKSGKRISNSDLEKLGKYRDQNLVGRTFYESCVSYNEYYDAYKQAKDQREIDKETAKAYKRQIREQMVSNIRDDVAKKQESYSKKDEESNRKINLYEARSDNAKSASKKNEYLQKAADQHEKIVENDQKELDKFTGLRDEKASRITKEGGKNHGSKYKNASDSKKKSVDDLIEKIKSDVKAGKRIKDSDLEKLGRYYDDGLIGNTFYDSCIYYNEYYDAAKEAQDSYYIDKETAKAYKESVAVQSFKNVENEHNNKLNTNDRKRSLAEAKQRVKQTRGSDLTLEDYQELGQINSEREKLLKKEKKALQNEIDTQLANGNWTEKSQGYIDAIDKISQIDEEIIDCKVSQEEYNNAIANLPLEKLEKELQLLDAIENNISSINKLSSESGKDLSTADYNNQINAINDRIRALQGLKNEARLGYEQALAAEDGVYGGKTADEWQKEVYDYDTEINNLQTSIVSLKKEMRDDVLWRPFRRAHDECKRFADVLSGVGNLIDDEAIFDSDGNMTDLGAAKIANLAKQYENARKEVQNYSNDLAELEKLKSQGEYENIDEYNQKLAELKSNLLDSASTMKSSVDAIINIYKEQGQKELDAVFELIDARKEALDKKKAWIITCFLC